MGNGLSIEQEHSHFALWAIMKGPLLMGTDLTNLTQEQIAILQNKYLLQRAEIRDFKSDFMIHDDGTISYTSDRALKLAAAGEEMHHTDKNTLHRVKRYHPSAEAS